MRSFHVPRRFFFSVLTVLVFLPTGCSKPAFGKVSGKVMLGDQPITGGTVFIVSMAGGTPVSASINPDGTYRIEHVPAGQCLVSLINPPDDKQTVEEAVVKKRMGQQVENATPSATPPASATTKQGAMIPPWYGDPTSSGLVVKVAGETTLDIRLTTKKPDAPPQH